MKFHEFFQQTLGFIGCKVRNHCELELTFRDADPAEMISTTRVEAAQCAAYLEKLFSEPRIDRNMRKIIQSVQCSTERALVLLDSSANPQTWADELAERRRLQAMMEYVKYAVTTIFPVLQQLVDLFFRFMDVDRTMPLFYYIERAGRYQQMWQSLLEDQQYSEAVMEELHWLQAPFELDEAGEPQADLTYRELYDLESTTVEVFDAIRGQFSENERLKKARVQLWNSNFNLEGYAVAVFKREISGMKGLPLPEQISGMVSVINRVRQRKRATHRGFGDNAPLKDNVMQKLTDHLDGLKMSYSVSVFLRDEANPGARPQRIKVSLKTEKLGYLLRYLQEHTILEAAAPGVLLNFVSTFFQPSGGGKYDVETLSAAYHATPVISEHNVKRILDPRQ